MDIVVLKSQERLSPRALASAESIGGMYVSLSPPGGIRGVKAKPCQVVNRLTCLLFLTIFLICAQIVSIGETILLTLAGCHPILPRYVYIRQRYNHTLSRGFAKILEFIYYIRARVGASCRCMTPGNGPG